MFFNIAVIIATFIAYASPLVDPKFTWTVSFFGLFYPVLLLLNILFIIFWIFKKPIYLIPSLACILIGWTHLTGFINFNTSAPVSDGSALKMMTYNISNASFGYHKNKEKRDKKKSALIEFLKIYEETDVMCFQEVGDYALEILKNTFKNHKIYHTKKGAVILSKHPMIKKGNIDFGTITNSCLWADIKIDSDTVRIYSFHLQSNQITNDAEKIVEKVDLNEKQTWYDLKAILRKFRNHHLDRSSQAEQIAAHAAKSPHRVILGGDLNDPPQSFTYRQLAHDRQDAFRVKGRGIGTTYAGLIPLLRIDYIFVDPHIEIKSFDLIKKDFSDHYPLLISVELNRP